MAILLGAAVIGAVAGVVLQRVTRQDEPPGAVLPVPVDALPRSMTAATREPSQPPQAMSRLPLYPGASAQPLGDDARVHGMDLSLAWFTTRDPVEQVVAWYERELEERGHYVLSSRLPGGARYVGFHDAEAGETNTVTVMEFGGETLVLPALGHTRDMKRDAEVPAELPHPDDAEGTAVVRVRDGGVVQITVVAKSASGVDRLTEFYRTELTRRGWTLEDVAVLSSEEGRLVGRLRDRSAQVLLTRDTDGGYPITRIHVHMTRRA